MVLIRGAAQRFTRQGGAFFAQAIAFNAIFAIFPLTLLAIFVLGLVYGGDEAQARAYAIVNTLAPWLEPLLEENLKNLVSIRTLSGIVGLVTLVWGAKNLFQSVAYSLDRALEVPESRPLVADIAVAIVTLPVLLLILVIATAIPLAIAFLIGIGGLPGAQQIVSVAGYAISLLLVFAVTALTYVLLPNRRIDWKFGVPGGIFVAVAWGVAQVAFTIYTQHTNFAHVYGAVSAFLVVMLWFYYMSTIFLFGVQVSAQWWAMSERRAEVVPPIAATVEAVR